MEKKRHYKRFFILVTLFGLIASSVVYASDVGISPFSSVSGSDQIPLEEILPNLPEIVTPDQDPDPETVPKEEPVQESVEKEEDPIVEDPSGSESENTISENTVSGNEEMDPDLDPAPSNSLEPDSVGGLRAPYIINISDVNADNFYKYSLSADNVKISQLEMISQNLVSINEVLRKHEKIQKDLAAKLSGISRDESTYKKDVLVYLLSIADSLSRNKIKVSADEIRVSLAELDQIYEVSENMISENKAETVSENSPDPETVSEDDITTISEDVVSISKGDLEQLHKDNEQLHQDLKSIFYVGIFGVIFLAMIAAGNLEQIIFKRLRG